MRPVERGIEGLFFSSRWLMAPFLVGLVVGLMSLLYKFVYKVVEFVVQLKDANSSDVIVGILSLIDFSLTANLVLIVICSTFENFVRAINATDHPTWPEGLMRIGFAGLKQKLLSSIVAIASVNVLERLLKMDLHFEPEKLAWVLGSLLVFALTMLILALADRTSAAGGH